jgi:ribonuclease P protein component
LGNGPTSARFEQIFSKGLRRTGRFLRLIALPGVGKLGVATSRSLGNRPARNRYKRRILAAWRSFPKANEMDCVVIVQRSASQATFTEIVSDLESLKCQIENLLESESASD